MTRDQPAQIAAVKKSAEPQRLRKGKEFHALVQSDWLETAEGAIRRERTIPLTLVEGRSSRLRKGRMDLFVSELGDFVSVVEIKCTEWDRIRPANITKNLGSHRRQIWKYIVEFTDVEKSDVCAGVIYPSAPGKPGLKDRIEEYMGSYGIQVVWFFD